VGQPQATDSAGWAKLVVSVLFIFRLAANFAWTVSEATVTCVMTAKAEEYKTQGNDLFQKVCDHSSNTD
jgi:hypothetical protein